MSAPMPDAIRGDVPCSRCGDEDYPVWWTDSDFWNAVVRSAPLPWMADTEQPNGDGLMCFTCFAVLAYERGFNIRGWTVSPRLDAIEARRKLAGRASAVDPYGHLAALVCVDVPALVAEVRRLRAFMPGGCIPCGGRGVLPLKDGGTKPCPGCYGTGTCVGAHSV